MKNKPDLSSAAAIAKSPIVARACAGGNILARRRMAAWPPPPDSARAVPVSPATCRRRAEAIGRTPPPAPRGARCVLAVTQRHY